MADVPDELSEWVDGERRRWNSQAARVCEVLAARDWHIGRQESSIELARQWERLLPHELGATVALAGYLAASGEAHEALTKLQTFRAAHRTLTQAENGQLQDALARLRSGAPLNLPERPRPTNGTSNTRHTLPRQPDVPHGATTARLAADRTRPARRDARRRVSSRADNALRDEYRLAGWVRQPPERRDFYFAWCDHAARELTRLTSGAGPKVESLVWTLIAALGEDESFARHVREVGGLFLTDDGNWDRLYRAAAATILETYLDEVEKGTWP